MSSPSDTWRRLMGATLILVLMPQCASNEGLGGGIRMDAVRGAIKLEAQSRNETYFGSYTGLPKSSTNETIFREAVLLDLGGDIYHSRFLNYRALLDLGLEQRDLKQSLEQPTQKSRLTNIFFDVRGEFFRDSPYSGEVYGYRNQIETRQAFFPTYDATVSEVGANLRAKEWSVPSWLHYNHYRYDGRLGDKREEIRDNLRLEGATNGEEFRFEYRLEYNLIDGNTTPDPYDDYQASSSVGWSFGGELQHSLRASGFYREQTGSFANQTSNLSGNLGMGLSENLQWRTNALFDRTVYGDIENIPSNKFLWDSFLEHQLFESLRSRIGLEGFSQSVGDGLTSRTGGRISINYQKKTSFGRIDIGIRPEGYVQKESGNPNRLIPADNEAHRYTIGMPIFLNNLRVDASSIRITDSSRLTIYDEVADYVVQQSNLTTEIVIAVGSRIQPGETILVSYRYYLSSDRKFSSVGNAINVGFGFGEVANVGMYWGVSRQNLLSGVDDSTLDDIDELGFNFELHHKAHNIIFDFLDRNSNFNPLRRFRLDARASFLPDPDLSLDLDAGAYRILTKDTGTWEWGLNAGGVSTWNISDRLSFRLSAIFKRIDRSTDLGRGWYVDSRLRYDPGKTLFELRILGSQERWVFQNDNNIFRVYITVRRDF